MKLKSIVLLLLLVLGFITSCSSLDGDNNNIIVSTLIGKGNLHGNGQENIEPQNLVITNSNSWNELMNQMNSVNNESEKFTETTIDFSKFTIIAVFDEVKPSGGHSIELHIVEKQNDIKVKIRNIHPGDIATTVMTQPYHIVKIPKTKKAITFE